MIFGENTLGKSTFIQSVIYALKGEELYGNRNIVNFRDLFKINYRENVEESHIYIQLVNDGNRVIVIRNAQKPDDPVVVLKGTELHEDSNLESLLHDSSTHDFYKMRKENNLKGNETYQEFLFKFMNITPIKDEDSSDNEDNDNSDTKLLFYIQNLMPLFIIHQGAWHDIQAINPRYGLKDIKKTAFEVLLNFTGTEVIQARFELEKLESLLKQKNTSLKDIEELIGTLLFKQSVLIESEIEKVQKGIDENNKKIDEIELGSNEANNVINDIRNQFRISSLKARRYRETMNSLETEIEEYNFYINKILNDIEKNDKLKTAKKIIGILPIETCPHCLNALTINVDEELHSENCGLCGSPFKTMNYSQNDQYLGYLKDELKDFKRLKLQKEEEKQQLYSKVVVSELEQAELKKTMNDFEEKLKPKKLQSYNFHSREIGRLENVKTQLKKDKELILKYENLLNERTKLIEDVKNKKTFIKNIQKQKENDEEKLKYFEEVFKSFLKKLDFLKMGLDEEKIKNDNKDKKVDRNLEEVYDQIKIDRFDYLPKIEDRNLYYLTSSSGLIRIILSYYTALLKTALKFAKDVQHPFLLIMDEPRQQNLDIQTFNNFLLLFDSLKKEYPNKFQVIILSSEKGDRSGHDIALDLGKTTRLLERVSIK
ncbi:AAA domain-containing protein [Paenibacillus sp. cl141a]|nr:AAA domain-containing protein [Paenibacillus sp. cl141a]